MNPWCQQFKMKLHYLKLSDFVNNGRRVEVVEQILGGGGDTASGGSQIIDLVTTSNHCTKRKGKRVGYHAD